MTDQINQNNINFFFLFTSWQKISRKPKLITSRNNKSLRDRSDKQKKNQFTDYSHPILKVIEKKLFLSITCINFNCFFLEQ